MSEESARANLQDESFIFNFHGTVAINVLSRKQPTQEFPLQFLIQPFKTEVDKDKTNERLRFWDV